MPIPAMTPAAVKQALDRGEKIVLLDVREQEEVDICRLDGSVHIPMAEIQGRFAELEPKAATVVYCHHGVRSQMVANFLQQNGFADVRNLSGGIDHWAHAVDPAMSRY